MENETSGAHGCIGCAHKGMKYGPADKTGRRTIELATDAWSDIPLPPLPGWMRAAQCGDIAPVDAGISVQLQGDGDAVRQVNLPEVPIRTDTRTGQLMNVLGGSLEDGRAGAAPQLLGLEDGGSDYWAKIVAFEAYLICISNGWDCTTMHMDSFLSALGPDEDCAGLTGTDKAKCTARNGFRATAKAANTAGKLKGMLDSEVLDAFKEICKKQKDAERVAQRAKDAGEAAAKMGKRG